MTHSDEALDGLAFVDIETTGLNPESDEPWEVGLIIGTTAHRWTLPVQIERADSVALGIGRYHERHPKGNAFNRSGLRNATELVEISLTARGLSFVSDPETTLRYAAEQIARLTHGRHLVGNVVSFDAAFLASFLRRNGFQPSWHYHLVDVESLCAGWLGAIPPWNSRTISDLMNVDAPMDSLRHTAVGDAIWARDLYLAWRERCKA